MIARGFPDAVPEIKEQPAERDLVATPQDVPRTHTATFWNWRPPETGSTGSSSTSSRPCAVSCAHLSSEATDNEPPRLVARCCALRPSIARLIPPIAATPPCERKDS